MQIGSFSYSSASYGGRLGISVVVKNPFCPKRDIFSKGDVPYKQKRGIISKMTLPYSNVSGKYAKMDRDCP